MAILNAEMSLAVADDTKWMRHDAACMPEKSFLDRMSCGAENVATVERLLTLFTAFREHNDGAFRRAADSIVADELAANHHAVARELQKALGPSRNPSADTNGFRMLPKSRRPTSDLLFYPPQKDGDSGLILSEKTGGEIDRVLDEHRRRIKLAEFGFRPKARLLFWGPPGCGKSLAAAHVAQSLGLRLGVVRLSAAVSSYLGETSARLQQVFDEASQDPIVLFFDEVDTVAKNRDDHNDVGELKRVVNSLLQAMDAFVESRSILIAASNHQHLLDPAIWRRFDAVIRFPLPSSQQREALLKRLLNGVRVSGQIGEAVSAAKGLSFADIERSTIEAVKTMILGSDDLLKVSEIVRELHKLRASVSIAKKRETRSARESGTSSARSPRSRASRPPR